MGTVHEARIGRFELKHPVYIGDTLYAESICTGKRESRNRPGLGIISMFTRGLNQDGDVVITWKRTVMVPRSGQGIGENYFPQPTAGPLTAPHGPAAEEAPTSESGN